MLAGSILIADQSTTAPEFVRFGSRLCENACSVLKSALLRKICPRLVNQQTGDLRRSAIFAPVLTVKPALKPFHTAWVDCSRS
jgi:hypothetical protein